MSAKSRRDDKPVFEFPEFDREEYIEKEFRDARTSRLVILLAFLIAILSYSLVRIDESYRIVGLLIIFLAIAGLKDVFRVLRVDTTTFERKNWIGNSLLLFFAWFGMFTLFLNPPFYDMIDPRVESIDLYTIQNETSGNITYSLDDSPEFIFNSTISINATVADNTKIDNVTLVIVTPGGEQETRFMEKTGVRDHEYTGGFLRLDQEGSYTFRITVEDTFGNSRERSRSIMTQA